MPVIASIIAGFVAAFVVLGGLSVGYSLPGIVLLAAMGAAIGTMAAPEIAPKQFRRHVIWQTGSGVVAALAVAALIAPTFEGFGLAAIAGGLIGYLVPYWIRHITLP